MNENWTDKLIDAHLEEANTVEPSLGFESRLLANVTDQRATRKRPIFWMVWASAAVAAMIVAIVFLTPPVSQKPAQVETAKLTTPQPSSGVALPRVDPALGIAMQRVPPKRPRDEVATAMPVRQEVFPAPSPLSDQERLAFAYLRGTPRSEVIAMSRPEPEFPQEINQAIPDPEVNRTVPSSNR